MTLLTEYNIPVNNRRPVFHINYANPLSLILLGIAVLHPLCAGWPAGAVDAANGVDSVSVIPALPRPQL